MLPAQAPSASFETALVAEVHSVDSAQHGDAAVSELVAVHFEQHEPPSEVVSPAASVTALRPGMLPVLAYTPIRVTRTAAAIPARIFVVISDTPIERNIAEHRAKQFRSVVSLVEKLRITQIQKGKKSEQHRFRLFTFGLHLTYSRSSFRRFRNRPHRVCNTRLSQPQQLERSKTRRLRSIPHQGRNKQVLAQQLRRDSKTHLARNTPNRGSNNRHWQQ